MPASLVPLDMLIAHAQSSNQVEINAALYWIQRLLQPEAVEYLLERHHVAICDRLISRITWLHYLVKRHDLSLEPGFAEQFATCSSLLERFEFARQWVPHEDCVAGATKYGYADSLTYLDVANSFGTVYLNLNPGGQDRLIAYVSSRTETSAIGRQESCALLASASDLGGLQEAVKIDDRLSLEYLESLCAAYESVDPAGPIAPMIDRWIRRRWAAVLHDAWLLAEDDTEIARRFGQASSMSPLERGRGAYALASIGDRRALETTFETEPEYPVPEEWRICARWLGLC